MLIGIISAEFENRFCMPVRSRVMALRYLNFPNADDVLSLTPTNIILLKLEDNVYGHKILIKF